MDDFRGVEVYTSKTSYGYSLVHVWDSVVRLFPGVRIGVQVLSRFLYVLFRFVGSLVRVNVRFASLVSVKQVRQGYSRAVGL